MSKYMAADTQVTSRADNKTSTHKIFVGQDRRSKIDLVFGIITGQPNWGMAMAKWYEEGAIQSEFPQPSEENWTRLIVDIIERHVSWAALEAGK